MEEPEKAASVAEHLFKEYANEFLVREIHRVLVYEHRTIQQRMVRNLFGVLSRFAVDNTGTDLRNEASVALCKRLREELCHGMDDPGLPYI